MIFAAFAGVITITAAPVNFSEVSLWVRARETDRSIVREVSQRKLARPLTPQQESTLKSQGASDSLVQSLRSPNVIAAPADVAASETKPQPQRMPPPQDPVDESAADGLHIFEVPSGHPINLSQWGGPDYEFAFNVLRFAGEDVVEPIIVDTVRTYTEVVTCIGPLGPSPRSREPHFRSERFTPYLGGDLKDDSNVSGEYISVMSHSAYRGMSIDRRNPVFVKGVPYTLYPIYGVRGVSLYYITHGPDSVRLAINTSR
jgi:hypothetical protein